MIDAPREPVTVVPVHSIVTNRVIETAMCELYGPRWQHTLDEHLIRTRLANTRRALESALTIMNAYEKPPQGWTCFHCGETLTTFGAARDHFGADPLCDPACRVKAGEERGLVMALRRAEAELARYRAEDSDADRQFYKMRAEHVVALRQAEEDGYNKGVRDALAEPRPITDAMVEAACVAWYGERWTGFGLDEIACVRRRDMRRALEAAEAARVGGKCLTIQ